MALFDTIEPASDPDLVLAKLQSIASRYPASSRADYLEQFRTVFQKHLEAMEGPTTTDLESRGPSDDLMHDWSLFIAQGRDFLAALAAEIERVR